jgi:hypothetical protein
MQKNGTREAQKEWNQGVETPKIEGNFGMIEMVLIANSLLLRFGADWPCLFV